jgi:hypothetical protein
MPENEWPASTVGPSWRAITRCAEATVTQVAVHGAADFRLGGAWIARQEFAALDQHAVDAVAALRRLHVDEGLLQRMQGRCRREVSLLRIPGREPLERGHGPAADGVDRRLA